LDRSDPNAVDFTPAEADCMTGATVDRLGVARLEETGLDAADDEPPKLTEPPLTAEEADALYAIYGQCTDLTAKVAGFLAAEGALSPETADCVAKRYEASGLLRRSLFGAESDEALNRQIDDELTSATRACS
jgi:hypothetical protein